MQDLTTVRGPIRHPTAARARWFLAALAAWIATSIVRNPAPAFAQTPSPDPSAELDHTGTPRLPPRDPQLPPPSAKPGERRPLPRYDGRAPEDADAGEVLIWIPRVVFFPAYLALEYLLRWPLVSVITAAEKHHVFEKVERFFTFHDPWGGKGGVFPTWFADFGRAQSLGVSAFYNPAKGPHHLSLQAGYWPTDWVNLVLLDTFTALRDDTGTVTLRLEYISRPDFIFNGIGSGGSDGLGPAGSGDNERFFRLRELEAGIEMRGALSGLNRFNLALLYRTTKITDSSSTPTLGDTSDTVFDVNDPNQVPGWNATYHLFEASTKIELDTRNPNRVWTSGSGVRLELFGSYSLDPHNSDLSFFRWGGEAAGFWDISGINHVIAIRAYAEALESIGEDPVPLTELIELGGDEYLRGFLEGRWRGESALEFTIDYRYPFWIFFDANIFVSLGNVFNQHWSNAHIKRMVMAWGLALRTNTSRDVSFDILFAMGTNQLQRWDTDFEIDNFRFAIGINQGF